MTYSLVDGIKIVPPLAFSQKEQTFFDTVKHMLEDFPVTIIRIRKNFSSMPGKISIDIGIEPTLAAPRLFKIIGQNIGTALKLPLEMVSDWNGNSPFGFYFQGQGLLAGSPVIVFCDSARAL